jgi:hypothetical protein
MIRKSVQRFSEKIMLKNLERDGDSTQSHRALRERGRSDSIKNHPAVAISKKGG